LADVGTATAPDRLRVVAHPLRWRLLEELGRSDRRVQDLVALVGEPQNLVSYHLRTLRSAGLVRSRRSSADGRDAWYAADLPVVGELLAGAGAALHPSLQLAPTLAGPPPAGRVLFLCTGNSARSQMAEGFLTRRSGGRVRARSAGSHPKPLHPLAVRVMQEHGVDLSGRRSRSIDAVRRQRFDRVVTLCDRVREVCPELPGRPAHAHWSIPDPAAGRDADDPAALEAFRSVAAELDRRTAALLAELARPRTEEHP